MAFEFLHRGRGEQTSRDGLKAARFDSDAIMISKCSYLQTSDLESFKVVCRAI